MNWEHRKNLVQLFKTGYMNDDGSMLDITDVGIENIINLDAPELQQVTKVLKHYFETVLEYLNDDETPLAIKNNIRKFLDSCIKHYNVDFTDEEMLLLMLVERYAYTYISNVEFKYGKIRLYG